jgi:hypothetical protein
MEPPRTEKHFHVKLKRYVTAQSLLTLSFAAFLVAIVRLLVLRLILVHVHFSLPSLMWPQFSLEIARASCQMLG